MNKLKYITLILLLLTAFSCEKDTKPETLAPDIQLEAPSNRGRSYITLNGMVSDLSQIKEIGFVVWKTGSDKTDKYELPGYASNQVTVSIKNLEVGTTYSYYMYVGNDINLKKTEEQDFTTPQTSAALIGSTQKTDHTFMAAIEDNGGSAITTKGFCWSQTGRPSIFDNTVLVKENSSGITASIPELASVPSYSIRAFAQNEDGYLAYGPELNVESSIIPTEKYTITKKASFGGGQRYFTMGFSIGSKGYAGGGKNKADTPLSDWWEYNPDTDEWNQLGNLPASHLYGTTFTCNGKGYMGLGENSNQYHKYNPESDTWQSINSYVNFTSELMRLTSFSVNGTGYTCSGHIEHRAYNTLFSYSPVDNRWTEKKAFPGGEEYYNISDGAVLPFGNKVYICGGQGWYGGLMEIVSRKTNDCWEYNTATNQWTLKNRLPFFATNIGFVINDRGYVLAQTPWNEEKIIYEYNPDDDSWKEVKRFNAEGEFTYGVSFVINNKAYFGTGYRGDERYACLSDFFEFKVN